MSVSSTPIPAPSAARRRPRAASVVRVLLGAVFLLSGLPKLLDHAAWAADFARWGVPLPDLAVTAVGGFEVVGGLLLAAGIATRPLAALFAVHMGAALLFAGTSDGGQHVVLPLLLGGLAAASALRARPA